MHENNFEYNGMLTYIPLCIQCKQVDILIYKNQALQILYHV